MRLSSRVLTNLIPPTPLSRRLASQSVLFGVGEGAFLTGSAFYFTHLVGLSAAQVGLGLTIAGLAAFATSFPAGKVADGIGPKRAWWIGNLATALLYLSWPLVDGFGGFLAVLVTIEVINRAAGAGRGAYLLDVLSREERVRTQAYFYSAINVGFTVGALLGGAALAVDGDHLIRAVPFLTGAIGLLNAFFVLRLPDARRTAGDTETPERALAAAVTDSPAQEAARPGGPSALRNRGFLATSFFSGVLNTHQVLLNVVIPLWLVEETDAPRALLALLFGTNTVMCIFLPVVAARGVTTIPTALRAARRSIVFFVLSCAIVVVTHDTVGWVTIVLVWLGHVTVTITELLHAPANWAFQAELSDPDRRGEYQGAAELGRTAGEIWAPAAFTFLAMEWGTPGWAVIAACIVVAGLGLQPSTRAAERFLARHRIVVT